MLPGAAGGALPWAVIGHRTFDAEVTPVEVGDDQEKRAGGFGLNSVSMPPLLPRNLRLIKDVIRLNMRAKSLANGRRRGRAAALHYITPHHVAAPFLCLPLWGHSLLL